MCSLKFLSDCGRPQSTSATFSPASVKRLHAHPPEAPEPTTTASKTVLDSSAMKSSRPGKRIHNFGPRLEFLHCGFTAGPQLITALSEGRGYGEAGGEGSFSWFKISESLTHPACGIPPLPQAGEGCCQLIFRRQTKMYKLQGSPAASKPSPGGRRLRGHPARACESTRTCAARARHSRHSGRNARATNRSPEFRSDSARFPRLSSRSRR